MRREMTVIPLDHKCVDAPFFRDMVAITSLKLEHLPVQIHFYSRAVPSFRIERKAPAPCFKFFDGIYKGRTIKVVNHYNLLLLFM